MALAKERTLEGSQTRSLYGNVHGGGGGRSIQGLDPSSVHVSSYKGHDRVVLEDGEGTESLESYSRGIVPLLSDPSNSPSGSFVFGPVDSSLQEAHSVVNFKAASVDHWAYSSSSVLSFEQGDTATCTNYKNINQEDHESAIWMDAMDENYQLNLGVVAGGSLHQESVERDKGIQKRPYTGGDLQASKKHCGNTRKTKAKPGPSKDPQSVAAKVLATDEFWPAQGGKAPDVSQVKEAIDAILSSHRNRNSS